MSQWDISCWWLRAVWWFIWLCIIEVWVRLDGLSTLQFMVSLSLSCCVYIRPHTCTYLKGPWGHFSRMLPLHPFSQVLAYVNTLSSFHGYLIELCQGTVQAFLRFSLLFRSHLIAQVHNLGFASALKLAVQWDTVFPESRFLFRPSLKLRASCCKPGGNFRVVVRIKPIDIFHHLVFQNLLTF